jgi:phage terminase large subunit
MKLSRDYINSEAITDFSLDSRFFAFPVENLLEIENITPNKPQIAIINALNSPNIRFVTACVSRRVGKSFIAYTLGFLKALEPNCKILIICPNYSLSNIGWTQIKELIKKYGLETIKENAKDKEIVLSNNTLIKLASVSQADSAVGRSYDLIIFDEAAISSAGGDAFNIQLRPTLDKFNSKALFISTPRGNNWFHTFYMRGFSDLPEHSEWCSIHGTYKDNPRAQEKDIAEARANNSPAFFRQEYEADFTTFEGQIYEEFDEDNIFDDAKLYERLMTDPECEGLMGIDPGFRDPTAIAGIKYDDYTDTYYIMMEHSQNSSKTSDHAAIIRKFEAELDPSYIFIDSAAAQFIHDLVYEYDIGSSKANKSKREGIGFIATLVATKRIKVWHECTGIIEMFYNYRWDTREELKREEPVHDKYSHYADAVRYGIYSHNR